VYKRQAVKSVRSEVTNIQDYLSVNNGFDQFKKHVFEFVMQHYAIPQSSSLTTDEIAVIENLRKEKYDTWQWNYGYSPLYEFSRRIRIHNSMTISRIKVEKGKLSYIDLKSSEKNLAPLLSLLSKQLIGSDHDKKIILSKINKLLLKNNLMNSDDVVKLFI
jgi:lipoate-protein ligase A